MIVALGFGGTEGDTPSVFIVDTEKCTEEWQYAIQRELKTDHSKLPDWSTYKIPKDWESLEDAKVELPAMVEAAMFLYYDG